MVLPWVVLGLIQLVPLAAGAIGLVLPLGVSPASGPLAPGFSGQGQASAVQLLLAQPGLSKSVWLSLTTGLFATALAFAVVVLLLAGWIGTRTLGVLRRCLGPFLALPHAAAAIGLTFLLTPSGLIFRALSPWATGLDRAPDLTIVQDPAGLSLMLALTAKEIPFLLLMALAALPQTRCEDYLRTAQSLGYGRFKAFICLGLPDLYPHLRLPILAVLAFAASNVDMATILGPTLPASLSVRIVAWMNDPAADLRAAAAAGAGLQGLICAVCILLWLAGERVASTAVKAIAVDGARGRADRVWKVVGLSLTWALFALLSGAIVSIALWSVARGWFFPDLLPGSWTLGSWRKVLLQDTGPLVTTVVLAALSSGLALLLVIWILETMSRRQLHNGLAPRESSALRAMMFFPLILPQVSLLLGIHVWFLILRADGTFFGVLFAHLIFVLPYVYLSMAGPWYRLEPNLLRNAQSLGLSDSHSFLQIKLPMLLRPLLTAFAIGFAVSVAQYLPSLMIGAGRWPTLTTESVALASGGARRPAAVYALLLMVLPACVFILATLIPAAAFRHRRGMRHSR
ncbi:ABC transporter permease [Roseibium sp.]|uniref:ABC transporter permease n=1 Tax=Roseibium sp. TaxID=1936156 RepID=UPI003A97366F